MAQTIAQIKAGTYASRTQNWKREETKAFDPTQCAGRAWGGWAFMQCSRKPGHGLGGLFCKQHARAYPVAPDDLESPYKPEMVNKIKSTMDEQPVASFNSAKAFEEYLDKIGKPGTHTKGDVKPEELCKRK